MGLSVLSCDPPASPRVAYLELCSALHVPMKSTACANAVHCDGPRTALHFGGQCTSSLLNADETLILLAADFADKGKAVVRGRHSHRRLRGIASMGLMVDVRHRKPMVGAGYRTGTCRPACAVLQIPVVMCSGECALAYSALPVSSFLICSSTALIFCASRFSSSRSLSAFFLARSTRLLPFLLLLVRKSRLFS